LDVGRRHRARVREGRMDAVLDQQEEFAVIIADPPWVPTGDTARFPEDPVGAIDGGADGLNLVRSCLMVMERHLAMAGSAVLQTGPNQAERVVDMVAGYDELAVIEVRRLERGALVQIDRIIATAP